MQEQPSISTSPPTAGDEQYQVERLQGVSRTFALTIPQLPAALARVVSNAYLLCRIADTIEDDPGLDAARQRHFSERFIDVVAGNADAEQFAAELYPLLSARMLQDERDLIRNTARVIRITLSFKPVQRAALARCIRIMASGMAWYQERESLKGLADLSAMDRYCYYVAGVVGEMLTELFCDYSAEIAQRREPLMRLAVSFGQGLQMTNILKDIWEDRSGGACWLPREIFARVGVDLEHLHSGRLPSGFGHALGEVIGVARGHLENALTYTLLIPPHETGIRRFCLWALGMAVLTLKKINARRNFSSGQEVKISRRSVRATILATNLAVASDPLLKWLFAQTTRSLPRVGIHERLATPDWRAGSKLS
ncbi:MAG: phytoene/squalene synthase family protein [Chromatiales bacterium]